MVARIHPFRLTVPITIFVLLSFVSRLGRLGKWGRSIFSHVTVTCISRAGQCGSEGYMGSAVGLS